MLEIGSKTLKAHILPYGATLAGLWHSAIDYSLVLGSDDETAYRSELAFFGAIVGPVANRISGGVVRICGREYRMAANDGANTLHSGKNGTHAQEWAVEEHSQDSVTLTLCLPDRANDLPGNRNLTANYRVTDDGEMHLTLSAETDAETVMNLAHHPYWNLDASETIQTHALCVNAQNFLPVDSELIPTGKVSKVAGTPYDFISSRPLSTEFGIDENYCLADRPLQNPRHAATLRGSSGVVLDIHTTEPGLQVYTGSGLPSVSACMHDDRRCGPFAGIALEPQRWPDAPRNPQFPSIILRPNEAYHQKTVYRIGT